METKAFTYSKDHLKLARIAKALSHPARLHILKFLASCDQCITGSIVDELPIAQSSVSQHLKELKEAGLIQGFIDTPRTFYCINRKNWNRAKKLFENFF